MPKPPGDAASRHRATIEAGARAVLGVLRGKLFPRRERPRGATASRPMGGDHRAILLAPPRAADPFPPSGRRPRLPLALMRALSADCPACRGLGCGSCHGIGLG